MLNEFVEKTNKLFFEIIVLPIIVVFSVFTVKAENNVYFLEATPLEDAYVTMQIQKALPSRIYLYESDSLKCVDTLYSDEFRILDVQQNYNARLFIIINEKEDNSSEISFINTESHYSPIHFTKCNRYGHPEISYVAKYQDDRYLVYPLDNDLKYGMNLTSLNDTLFTGAIGNMQFSSTSYGSFYNIEGVLEKSDAKTLLPDSLFKEDKEVKVCILDDFQNVFVIPNRQSKGHVFYSYYNNFKRQWGCFFVLGESSTINAFGSWLVGNIYYSDKEMGGHTNSPGKEIRDSIWNNDWYSPTERYQYPDYPEYRYRWGTGYTAEDRFRDMQIYSPGTMYLFNTETGVYFELKTRQGDSQILLVENENIYYRVNDEIYVAPIVDGKQIGESRLLVKDRIVVDIHWAFTMKK